MEDFVTRRASLEKPRRSISLSLPSLTVANGSSRKSFFYSKLHEEPIKLSVRKLDGSFFDVEVKKSATTAELKLAVQYVFSHMPQQGSDKISWPHVWGHFCLCYDGHKLLTDTDRVIHYGIKDGDQLHFVRHVSSGKNLTKVQSEMSFARKQSYLSSSRSSLHLRSEQNDEEGDGYDNTANGRHHSLNDKNQTTIVQQECQVGHLWRGWSSYSRMSTVKRTRSSKGRICHSGYGCGILGKFRKILLLRGSAKHAPKRSWGED